MGAATGHPRRPWMLTLLVPLTHPAHARSSDQVRLDANDQRHADEAAPLPTQQDAARSLGFALALADVLCVIPARVTRGIEESKPK